MARLTLERWQSRISIAETPFIRRGNSAYVIVEGPTWEEAEANAVALGGHLVTINDSQEWEWFKNEFTAAKYGYPESFGEQLNGWNIQMVRFNYRSGSTILP